MGIMKNQENKLIPNTLWMDSELMRKEVPDVAMNPVTVEVIQVSSDNDVYFCPENTDKQIRMPKDDFLKYFNYKGAKVKT